MRQNDSLTKVQFFEVSVSDGFLEVFLCELTASDALDGLDSLRRRSGNMLGCAGESASACRTSRTCSGAYTEVTVGDA